MSDLDTAPVEEACRPYRPFHLLVFDEEKPAKLSIETNPNVVHLWAPFRGMTDLKHWTKDRIVFGSFPQDKTTWNTTSVLCVFRTLDFNIQQIVEIEHTRSLRTSFRFRMKFVFS